MGASGLLAIGSGPAGVSAAETFRKHHPRIPVRILTADPALPYAKPPLSKGFLCGRQPNQNLHSQEWFVRNNVDLVRGIRVERIDLRRHEVVTSGGRHYPYWHLVMACGAAPVPLDVPGGDAALMLRSYADAVTLRMTALSAEHAVVVGGGLIGCEAAAGLASRGVRTTVVAAESLPLQRRFGVEVGERVEKMLSDIGVHFTGSVNVTGIDDDAVHLDNGTELQADLVVAATGVRPDTTLAADAGITTRGGRVVVDAQMRTSAADVFAAGDVALAHNVAAGRPVVAEHWRDAALQGMIAGETASGHRASWDDVPRFSCTIGDVTLKYRGWGPGYDRCRLDDHRDGFTAWYEADGEMVGMLSCNADDDYQTASDLVRSHAPLRN